MFIYKDETIKMNEKIVLILLVCSYFNLSFVTMCQRVKSAGYERQN